MTYTDPNPEIELRREYMLKNLRSAALYHNLARRAPADSGYRKLYLSLAQNNLEIAAKLAEPTAGALNPQTVARPSVFDKMMILTARVLSPVRFISLLALKDARLRPTASPTTIDKEDGLSVDYENNIAFGQLAKSKNNYLVSVSNNLRAAVLGINDGLVSNLSIVIGVAGGGVDFSVVLIAGVASLIAGGLSMAAGEYISVKSQIEIFQNLIKSEKIALTLWPKQQTRALTDIYRDKGLTTSEAETVTARLAESPSDLLDTKMREEHGINPAELGSPVGAAIYSIIAFTIGAGVPLIPFLIFQTVEWYVLVASFLSGAFVLFLTGGGLSLTAGTNPVWGATRMVLIGAFASGITFLVGWLFGVTVL